MVIRYHGVLYPASQRTPRFGNLRGLGAAAVEFPPDFLQVDGARAACALFINERRMRTREHTNPHRKSAYGAPALVAGQISWTGDFAGLVLLIKRLLRSGIANPGWVRSRTGGDGSSGSLSREDGREPRGALQIPRLRSVEHPSGSELPVAQSSGSVSEHDFSRALTGAK